MPFTFFGKINFSYMGSILKILFITYSGVKLSTWLTNSLFKIPTKMKGFQQTIGPLYGFELSFITFAPEANCI
jgi:hypothetical protein